MPRFRRPDYEHTYHHAIVRGVDGLPIFNTSQKKEKYIKIMIEALQAHDLSIYAVGFVNSHVHLFIRRNQHSMGVLFRRVNGQYGSWYNKRFQRTGALYDGRYYSTLVDSDGYFSAVWRYVHHQGVEANLYSSVKEDPWSSGRLYLGLPSKFDWIDWEEAINELGVGTQPAAAKMLEQEGKETDWYGKEKFPYEIYRGQRFLAGSVFIEKYMQIRKTEVRKKSRKKQETPISWEDLLEFAVSLSEIGPEEIVGASKKPGHVKHRSGLAYGGRKYGHFAVSELADKLQVSPSTISKMIKRTKENFPEIMKKWDESFGN